MSHIPGQRDADLHHPDTGEHRSTPPTTDGRQLARYETRIRSHLAAHALNPLKEELANRAIRPGDPEPDANGWYRDEVWNTDGDGCGDDQIGRAFQSRYHKQLADGSFAVVTYTYYAVPMASYTNGDEPAAEPDEGFDTLEQAEFMHCWDEADPGGTEITSEYQHDHRGAQSIDTLQRAEAECRGFAMNDARPHLQWEPEVQVAGRPAAQYLDALIQGYCVAMLWANTQCVDPATEDPTDHDVDQNWWTTPSPHWGIEAFDAESQASIRTDCQNFLREAARLLTQAAEMKPDYDAAQAGHDFALTRNHHGAGFWDRGLGQIGDQLTELTEPYGASDAWCVDPDLDLESDDRLAHLNQ